MNQIFQNLRTGRTFIETVPWPMVSDEEVLIQTHKTLVSVGTERMLVKFGQSNLLQKARQQPEKVRQVLAKAKTDGVLPTLDAVRNKLDRPLPLGYCQVGQVLESRATEFTTGDRVVSNGGHAEVVAVPKHLCARIPDGVNDESASFTVIGAIGSLKRT